MAEKNAAAILADSTRAAFVQSDLFEAVEGVYDIIVSNPPYIQTEVIQELMPEVREHEPRMALDGMEDGLYFYRRIVKECQRFLRKEGRLFFEIGYDQAETVKELMEAAGFVQVEVVKDFAGLCRVVHGVLG